jgi:Na+/H+ antiporter
MHYAIVFVLLLTFILGLGHLARLISVPYPILFVLGGLLIGFFPIHPHLVLDPNFIFFIFLPPLLYIQAFNTSLRDFRFYLRSIMLLAIGLVLMTTVAVAYTAHWLIPNFPLAAGFALGAIISPPDAIAASAIGQRLGLPRRLLTILEGESLVNDSTSLVIFKIALASIAVTGISFHTYFSFPVEFLYVSIGGVAVGLIIGWLANWIRSRVIQADSQLVLTTSLAVPFVSYLAADVLQLSGVLAVVTTGLYLGWRAPEDLSPASRLQARSMWDIIVYILNGMVFILIGLQLPGILHSMREFWWPRPFLYAVVINLVCMTIRIAWVIPGAYLPRLLSKRVRESEGKPDIREVLVVSWAGMRGVVSLAAALALNGYPDFPRSHLMQFLAFSVILNTLVFQGLTLPVLIRFLGLSDDDIPAQEEKVARDHISERVFEQIVASKASDQFPSSALERIEQFYRERSWTVHDPVADEPGCETKHQHVQSLRALHQAMIATQRHALLSLRRAGKIGDDVMHKIEHELDLEEAHLSL